MDWRQHVGTVTAVTSTALVAARLLAISRYDPTTAATILQTAGTGAVVIGTALSLLPFVVSFVACGLAVATYVDRTILGELRLKPELMVLTVGASLMLLPSLICALTLAFIAGSGVVGWRLHRSQTRIDLREMVRAKTLLRYEVAVLAVCLILTPIVLPQPWLPSEDVHMKDGRAFSGYVLGDLDGEIAFMSDRDREITLLVPADVTSRQICAGNTSLAGALSAAPRLTVHGSVLGSVLFGNHVPAYAKCPPEHRSVP